MKYYKWIDGSGTLLIGPIPRLSGDKFYENYAHSLDQVLSSLRGTMVEETKKAKIGEKITVVPGKAITGKSNPDLYWHAPSIYVERISVKEYKELKLKYIQYQIDQINAEREKMEPRKKPKKKTWEEQYLAKEAELKEAQSRLEFAKNLVKVRKNILIRNSLAKKVRSLQKIESLPAIIPCSFMIDVNKYIKNIPPLSKYHSVKFNYYCEHRTDEPYDAFKLSAVLIWDAKKRKPSKKMIKTLKEDVEKLGCKLAIVTE